MKKVLFFLCLLFWYQHSFSQTSTKDSLTKVMAAEICKEVTANEATLKSSNDWEMELGLMMLPVLSKHSAALEKIIPGFTMDGPGMETVSKDIGMAIALSCPSFLKLIASDKTKFRALAGDKEEAQTLKGVLVKVETGEFSCIHVRLPNGKVEKVWWMEYFEGANELKEKNRLNKNLTIVYKEKEIYNAGLNEYVNTKIAAGAKF